LKSSDFDEFLLSVDDIPFLGFVVTVDDVACLEEAFRVEGLGVRFGVLEIALNDSGTSNAKFSSHIIACDIVSILIDDPD